MTEQAHQVRRVEWGHRGLAHSPSGLGAKRKLAQGVSSGELDEIYERAVKAGALGARFQAQAARIFSVVRGERQTKRYGRHWRTCARCPFAWSGGSRLS